MDFIFDKTTWETLGVILGSAAAFFIPKVIRHIKTSIINFFDKIKNPISVEFKPETLRKNAEIDFVIRQMLARLLGKSDSSRAFLFTYHNGSFSTNNVPFRKMSCQYEVVREGVSVEKHNLQSIELTDVPELIEKLYSNIYKHAVVCVEKLPECHLKSILLRQGVHCFIAKVILIKGKINYGFMGISYNNKQCKKSECPLENLDYINEIHSIVEGELAKKK